VEELILVGARREGEGEGEGSLAAFVELVKKKRIEVYRGRKLKWIRFQAAHMKMIQEVGYNSIIRGCAAKKNQIVQIVLFDRRLQFRRFEHLLLSERRPLINHISSSTHTMSWHHEILD
jgi:hypothetical protein